MHKKIQTLKGIRWNSPEHSKILKFALWETFLHKVYNVKLKNYRRVMCHGTEEWDNI